MMVSHVLEEHFLGGGLVVAFHALEGIPLLGVVDVLHVLGDVVVAGRHVGTVLAPAGCSTVPFQISI